jgi:hypothetical protein
MADSHRGFELHQLLLKVAFLRLRDFIHGVPGSRQIRLRNDLGGSHAASPLRWRGSF